MIRNVINLIKNNNISKCRGRSSKHLNSVFTTTHTYAYSYSNQTNLSAYYIHGYCTNLFIYQVIRKKGWHTEKKCFRVEDLRLVAPVLVVVFKS